MTRLIVLTFGFLTWAWYEMSGGADFEPGPRALAQVETEELTAPAPEAVARVDVSSADLLALAPVIEPKVALTLAVAGDAPLVIPQRAKAEIVTAAPEPQPAAAPQPEIVGAQEPLYLDIRTVSGNRVNLRGGPGTSHSVVGRLSRGDEVVVLESNGDGWLRIRTMDDEKIGWMADFLVTASN